MIQNIILYSITGFIVIIGFVKDKHKSKKALLKSWKALEKILPQFLMVIILVGIVLSFFDAATISKIIGSSSGWMGVMFAAVVGSIMLIPGFIAFPLSEILLENGAGYMQIGAFVSTLMMVGVITFPIEIKFFGIKATIMRNSLAFVFSLFVALVIGLVVGVL